MHGLLHKFIYFALYCSICVECVARVSVFLSVLYMIRTRFHDDFASTAGRHWTYTGERVFLLRVN